jgi:hypothetical protein
LLLYAVLLLLLQVFLLCASHHHRITSEQVVTGDRVLSIEATTNSQVGGAYNIEEIALNAENFRSSPLDHFWVFSVFGLFRGGVDAQKSRMD